MYGYNFNSSFNVKVFWKIWATSKFIIYFSSTFFIWKFLKLYVQFTIYSMKCFMILKWNLNRSLISFECECWKEIVFEIKFSKDYIFGILDHAWILGNGAISWNSKKQTSIVISSIEAKYIITTNIICWEHWCFTNEIHYHIYDDNQNYISLSWRTQSFKLT